VTDGRLSRAQRIVGSGGSGSIYRLDGRINMTTANDKKAKRQQRERDLLGSCTEGEAVNVIHALRLKLVEQPRHDDHGSR
jgi:hypothetical protein